MRTMPNWMNGCKAQSILHGLHSKHGFVQDDTASSSRSAEIKPKFSRHVTLMLALLDLGMDSPAAVGEQAQNLSH